MVLWLNRKNERNSLISPKNRTLSKNENKKTILSDFQVLIHNKIISFLFTFIILRLLILILLSFIQKFEPKTPFTDRI